MATITPLNESDNWAVSRWVINTNFSNLNIDKQEILAEWPFVDWDKTKLDWITAWADMLKTVYDPTNTAKPLYATSQTVYANSVTWDDTLTIATGWGSVNAPFATIQRAIDQITDASINKKYTIDITGLFTEDIVLKPYLYLDGNNWTRLTWKITWNWENFLVRMQLVHITTDWSPQIDLNTNPWCVLIGDFITIDLSTSTANIQPTIIDGRWSYFELLNMTVYFTSTDTWANTWTTNLIRSWWALGYTVTWVTFIPTISQSSWNVFLMDDDSSAISSFNVVLHSPTITNASYSWTYGLFKSNIAWVDKRLNNVYTIATWAWSWEFVWITATWWPQTIKEFNSSILVSWFTNDYHCDIPSWNTLDSGFNNIRTTLDNKWTWTLNKVELDENWALVVNTDIIDENILLNGPTNNSLQDIFNIWFNAWWVSWSEITDNTDWSVTVVAWTWLIRIANTDQAQLKSFDIDENTNVTLVDWASNIVYVDYNAWTPIYASTTVRADVLENENDKYEVAEIVREWTTLHISQLKQQARSQGQQRAYSLLPVARADNTWLILWETWTRNITVDAWKIWRKYNKVPVDAKDTSLTDTFDSYYTTDSYTTWTKVTWDTQWNNTQYNDITVWLVAISPSSKFSFQDFYLNWEWDLVRIYAPAQYNSLSEAEEAPASPNLPVRLQNNSILIWRIVFQWNDTVAQSILSAFTTTFSAAATSDHWNLSWLADDDHLQYALLSGRVWWQTIYWWTWAWDPLNLFSTSNATKWDINIGNVLTVDETNSYAHSTWIKIGWDKTTNLPSSLFPLTISWESVITAQRFFTQNNASTAAPSFLWYKARWTEASPTAIQNGDKQFSIISGWHDGTSYTAVGQIAFFATENWSPTTWGTKMIFSVVENGTTSPTEAIKISEDGNAEVKISNWLFLTDKTSGSIPFFGTNWEILEDNPNLFWDDTNNRLDIIGPSAATSRLYIENWNQTLSILNSTIPFNSIDLPTAFVLNTDTSVTWTFWGIHYGATNNVFFGRANGTEASPTTVLDWEEIMAIYSLMHTWTSLQMSWRIRFRAQGTPSATSSPSQFEIMTTASWSVWSSTRMIVFAEWEVNIWTTTLDGSAILNVQSTTKGFLPPKMTTTQRDAIWTPATWLVIYNTTTNVLDFYNWTSWGAV